MTPFFSGEKQNMGVFSKCTTSASCAHPEGIPPNGYSVTSTPSEGANIALSLLETGCIRCFAQRRPDFISVAEM